MPRICRPAAPAPLAIQSGTQPRMKAKEVMRIGRRRSRAPSSAASTRPQAALEPGLRELDDQDRVLGGEPDQHHEADLPEDVEGEAARGRGRGRRPTTATGTESSTLNGSDQLS